MSWLNGMLYFVLGFDVLLLATMAIVILGLVWWYLSAVSHQIAESGRVPLIHQHLDACLAVCLFVAGVRRANPLFATSISGYAYMVLTFLSLFTGLVTSPFAVVLCLGTVIYLVIQAMASTEAHPIPVFEMFDSELFHALFSMGVLIKVLYEWTHTRQENKSKRFWLHLLIDAFLVFTNTAMVWPFGWKLRDVHGNVIPCSEKVRNCITWSEYCASSWGGRISLFLLTATLSFVVYTQQTFKSIAGIAMCVSLLYVGVFSTNPWKLEENHVGDREAAFLQSQVHHQAGVGIFLAVFLLVRLRTALKTKNLSNWLYLASIVRWTAIFLLLSHAEIKHVTIIFEIWLLCLCAFGLVYEEDVFQNYYLTFFQFLGGNTADTHGQQKKAL